MKTNRRGFFGALAGLAGGVYAAFLLRKKTSLGKVDSWKLPSETKRTKTKNWACKMVCEQTSSSDISVTYYAEGEDGELRQIKWMPEEPYIAGDTIYLEGYLI